MKGSKNAHFIDIFRLMRPFIVAAATLLMWSCKSTKVQSSDDAVAAQAPVNIEFSADSAYAYCAAQCDFGPRTMNSEAHRRCAEWIGRMFEQFGCTVARQEAVLTGYDGTPLHAVNIIASLTPRAAAADTTTVGEASADSASVSAGALDDTSIAAGRRPRILLCAHWDSRPWADNDPDEANHRRPVMAANDGASGVAVMLELARLLHDCDSVPVDIDFVCFDAEDWGTPQWEENQAMSSETWALGARHWARHYAEEAGTDGGYDYGILLDMVGGQGARFFREGFSVRCAPRIVSRVWAAAKAAGYGSMFPDSEGGYVTDDHVPVNELAGIPCIDIIPYYPDCTQSNFGPTWHTVNDDMQHIDKNTLLGVGQTLLQVIFSEE